MQRHAQRNNAVSRQACRSVPASLLLVLLLTVSLSLPLPPAEAATNSLNQEIYDFDASWPIKSNRTLSVLGDKQTLYDNFMETCRKAAGTLFSSYSCENSENFRVKMNKFQPMSMRNYTELGFKKIKAPTNIYNTLKAFWDTHKEDAIQEWHSVNTYHNMWEAPPTLVNVQNASIGGGGQMQSSIWEMAREVLEEWTDQHLAPCSMWGIRIYHNNSILTPHVDRNPLVSSAIINVDQDVDEPWPLEVWAHDGTPYNITMEPGDMVLYESHSVIHGRPFPMRGRTYANIFVHFEPIGAERRTDPDAYLVPEEAAKETAELGLPPYVVPGSVWEKEWHKNNEDGWELYNADPGNAAQRDDVETLENLAIATPHVLFEPDDNGWTPLHEAVRAGAVDAVEFLVEQGAPINEVTAFGNGHSPLRLAEHHHGLGSELYEYLMELGAESLGPDL